MIYEGDVQFKKAHHKIFQKPKLHVGCPGKSLMCW